MTDMHGKYKRASDVGYYIPLKKAEEVLKSLKKQLTNCPECNKSGLKLRAIGLDQIPHYWCPDCNSIFMIKGGKIQLNKNTWTE